MTFTRLIINTVALVGVSLNVCARAFVYLHNNFGKRSHEGISHQSATQTASALTVCWPYTFSTNILPLSWNRCAAVLESFQLAPRPKCKTSSLLVKWDLSSCSESVAKRAAIRHTHSIALVTMNHCSSCNITLNSDHWLRKKMEASKGCCLASRGRHKWLQKDKNDWRPTRTGALNSCLTKCLKCLDCFNKKSQFLNFHFVLFGLISN